MIDVTAPQRFETAGIVDPDSEVFSLARSLSWRGDQGSNAIPPWVAERVGTPSIVTLPGSEFPSPGERKQRAASPPLDILFEVRPERIFTIHASYPCDPRRGSGE